MTDDETKELFAVDPEPTVPRPGPADEATAAEDSPPEKEPLNPYKYQRITMPPGLRAELIALARDQKPQRFLEDTVPPNAGGAASEAEADGAETAAVDEPAEVPGPVAAIGGNAGSPGARQRSAGWVIAGGLCVVAGLSAAVAVSHGEDERPSTTLSSTNGDDVDRVISSPDNTVPPPKTEPHARGVAEVTHLAGGTATPNARPARSVASAAKSPTARPSSSSGAIPAKKKNSPGALDTKSPIFSE